MADGTYGDLTEAEQAHWNEYQALRRISDWPGFDAAQAARKDAARTWLQNRRKSLWHAIRDSPGSNDRLNREERYDFLKDDNLNGGAPRHEVRLPCPATATNAEKAYIEEREIWFWVMSTTTEQAARKQECSDWLIARRQQLWALLQTEGDKAGRKDRWAAMCVATRTGKAYEEWNKLHNKWGVPYAPVKPDDNDIVKWCRSHLGTSERPAGSNKGEPQPSNWQRRVYGTDGVPWCACFSVCSAWDNGISGSGTASVFLNVELAKQGRGIFRGWTTDPARVQAGDHCAVGSITSHTEVVIDDNDPYHTIGGNTAPGREGSQYNGGTVAERDRYGEIVGWMLLRR